MTRPTLTAAAWLLILTAAAAAHGFEYAVETTTDRQVRIGGFYEGGVPMRGAAVEVRDADGKTVFTGTTGDDGCVTFAPPGPGDFAFTVDDRAGHKLAQRFVLRAFQLDGRVRDLVSEGGLPRSLLDRVRMLPRWLTAAAGLVTIIAAFAVIGWARSAAEVRRLRRERA
jgi:hypothetical protein